MDAQASQQAIPKKQMRWACPLGCEGGFINIPQTNEHLKKSHVTPKKGQVQGSITVEQMEMVRDVTKRHRLKNDRFKMQQIHQIFSKTGTDPDDLELHAATREDIKRMSLACAHRCQGIEPVMGTFRRLATREVQWFANSSNEIQDSMMQQACILIPHFLRSLGIEGILISDDEGHQPASPDEAELTSMRPLSTGPVATAPLAADENIVLNNSFSQVEDRFSEAQTVIGSTAESSEEWFMKPQLPNGQEGFSTPTPTYMGLSLNSAGLPPQEFMGHTHTTSNTTTTLPFPQSAYCNMDMNPRHKFPESSRSFNDSAATNIWTPPVPPAYRTAYNIVEDLAQDSTMDQGPW